MVTTMVLQYKGAWVQSLTGGVPPAVQPKAKQLTIKPLEGLLNRCVREQYGGSTEAQQSAEVQAPPSQYNPGLDGPTPDHMNLLGTIFSMCRLVPKLKWCAWVAVYCSFISFAASQSSEDTKQMMRGFMLSISAVVTSYLQNPQPMTPPW